MSTLAERYAQVSSGIDDAIRTAGRGVGEVTTIIVTKFHPATLVRELHDLGARDFGENRHQEAQAKAADLAELDGARWHFIGQLQSKKTRQVLDYARVVHSIDRDSVVDALERATADGPEVDAFVQINLTDDPARGGAAPSAVAPLVERLAQLAHVRLRGVMAVAPLDEEPRRAFARLRGYSEAVVRVVPEASAISAGMSHDYAEALLEGATHLRIGSAITGNRPDHG